MHVLPETSRPWTQVEDEQLKTLVVFEGEKNWDRVSSNLPTRSADSCKLRWRELLRIEEKQKVRGRWTPDEDERLVELIQQHGTKNWRFVAGHLPGRLPKQCRERWFNQLDPSVKKDGLRPDEWAILIEAHARLGNRWAELVRYLPGRTANHLKNQWNTMVRRREMEYSKKRKIGDLTEDANLSMAEIMTFPPMSPAQRQPLSPDSSESSSVCSVSSPRSPLKRSKLDDMDSDSDDSSTAFDLLVQASLGASSGPQSKSVTPAAPISQAATLERIVLPRSISMLNFVPSALPYLPHFTNVRPPAAPGQLELANC